MRAAKHLSLLLGAVALALASFHCASQQPPGGGPRDLVPPLVTETTPERHALHVHTRIIDIRFDKYVDHRTVQDAFFISPAVNGRPEFSWSGKRVEITLPDSLRPNTTYTISLGTDIADVRENIHLSAPYTLTFSTGPNLDSATISGRVFCDGTAGVFVFAYRIDNRSADTLNPTHTPPDFLAPVAKDSSYTIPALPAGVFRLMAIKDEQRNLVYDVGTDAASAARADVRIDTGHRTIDKINFRLAPPEDTIAPELGSADGLKITRVRVNVSEPLDSTTVQTARFKIRDSATHTPVRIQSALVSAKRTVLDVYTEPLTPDRLYILSADSMRDIAGNVMRPGTAVFTAIAAPDTTPPVVQWPFRDSITDVNDPRWFFAFDKPLQRPLAENAFTLSDSISPRIPLRFRWPSDATIGVYNDRQHDNQWYTISVNLQFFADPMNNHTRDSVRRFHFRTRDPRTLGEVKGAVVDLLNKTHAGYYVTARNVDTKEVFTRHVSEMGPFSIDGLPDGTYTIDGFRDDNGDGVRNAGHIVPWRFAEPYAIIPGTIRVRARWTVDGLRIVF